MDITADIVGVADLDNFFKEMPRSTQRKVIMPSLRAGAKEVRQRAEDNLKAVVSPDSTGVGERNIRVYTARKYRGNYRVTVQVRRGAVNKYKIVNGEPVRVGLYLSVLEYGKQGQAPRSWIRKAAREGTSDALNATTAEFNKRLVEAVNEAKK